MSNGNTAVKREGLSRLQSQYASTRRTRPPIMQFATGVEDGRVPLKAGKLQRQGSKGGLRAMFTRNKVGQSVISPVEEEPTVAPAILDRPMREIVENSLPSHPPTKPAPAILEAPITPSKSAPKPSRMNIRSVKQSKPSPKSASKSSPRSPPKQPTRTSAAWDPPPLFQAYPQAIKHAQLSASTLSADTILRTSNHKRNNSLRDELTGVGHDPSAAAKPKSKHRRQLSGTTSGAWTQKIFVLVTSGYLLQYSGDGSFDRLPEKMMQLGKDSVAFASDVIPGKHWVLQISQAMDADGTPAADSRSLLSRLAFRGADYRRTATSLLLVLNSAEDMDSWIAVVRREIEALGGKKHVSETGKQKPDEKVHQLKAQPSHRFSVQRNPDQASNPHSPMISSFGPPPCIPEVELQGKLEEASTSAAARPRTPRGSIPRPRTGHESIENSLMSHDSHQLDSLRDSTGHLDNSSREGTNRFSYVSSGQHTVITSQGSSTASSPTRESTSTFDDIPLKVSTEDIRPRPNVCAINERRRSMQTVQVAALDTQPKPFRPYSTFGVPTRPPSETPNFSIPTGLSKRFSTSSPVTQPIPTIITTTPSKTMRKGWRKTPPATLKMARPLSPVSDSSPKRALAISPTVASFNRRQQRSPTKLALLNTMEKSQRDFKFPRRISSMQALHDALEELPGAPFKQLALPQAALTKPLPPSPFIPDYSEKKEIPEPELIPDIPARSQARGAASMQVDPVSKLPTGFAKSPRLSHSASLPEKPTPLVSPSFNRLKQDGTRTLVNKQSMPTLVSGPPPAPPPDCALPPLPPGSAGLRSPLMFGKAVRV